VEQSTFVARLGESAGRRLYEEMGRGSYAFRTVPHARWSARGEDVTVTLYASGKLVVQGRGTEAFVARHLPDALPPSPQQGPEPALRVEGPTVGSDESGKGDYFGPLVVAAALVGPEDVADLAGLGVRDSKLATDAQVRRLEGVIARRVPHALRVLEPQAYNEAWAKDRNVNVLLGRLHAEVISEILARGVPDGAHIVVDRFGDPRHVRRHLAPALLDLPFAMIVRGEAHPAVATASFLARAAFLGSFERLRGEAGGELYMGASDPRIVPVARRLLREGGEAWLGRFAKLHFRVTERARGGRRS
jgi:ribonuclease HIII